MFKHYILCRYNLGLYSTNPYKVEDPDKWMDDRWPLFIGMFDSLQAQTNKDFTLVISMDYKTPSVFIDQIRSLLRQAEFHTLMVMDDPRVAIPKVGPKDWIVTSRMDNDDKYYPGFVQSIHDAFREETELLDVIGHQEYKGELYTSGRPAPNSPFISLVERWGNPRTVLCRPHSIMNAEYPARYATLEPMYIQRIHENNVANKLIGKKL